MHRFCNITASFFLHSSIPEMQIIQGMCSSQMFRSRAENSQLFSPCRGSFLAILTNILFSASCLQTAATSLTLVGNLCCQWSMLADLLLNCTLSNITVTALSSSLSTSPYRTGILSTAVSKRKNILDHCWVPMLQHNLKSVKKYAD